MAHSCGGVWYSTIDLVTEHFGLSSSAARWPLCAQLHHILCPPSVSYQNSNMIVSVLQCDDIIPEAASVLKLLPNRVEARSKPDFPVIVIEGLDATG